VRPNPRKIPLGGKKDEESSSKEKESCKEKEVTALQQFRREDRDKKRPHSAAFSFCGN